MTAALSDVYSVAVVDQIRALTLGVTDTPVLDHGRWELMVRRAAEADGEIAKIVARVDRRASLLGLARRYRGEASRADQHPGLRAIVDALIVGNGRTPDAAAIDKAVDEAAVWSARTRRRAEVVQIAVDQLPVRIGVGDRRWASQNGPPKRADDACAMVPVEPFARWIRHAAAGGDLDALIQVGVADAVSLDHGKYNGAVVPITTNNPAINVVRIWTWLLPVADRGSTRERAGLLLKAPQWRDGIERCAPVRELVTRIASGSSLLSLSVS